MLNGISGSDIRMLIAGALMIRLLAIVLLTGCCMLPKSYRHLRIR